MWSSPGPLDTGGGTGGLINKPGVMESHFYKDSVICNKTTGKILLKKRAFHGNTIDSKS